MSSTPNNRPQYTLSVTPQTTGSVGGPIQGSGGITEETFTINNPNPIEETTFQGLNPPPILVDYLMRVLSCKIKVLYLMK